MSNINETTPNITIDNDRGDLEKILAMTILGLGSLISGMLPAVISQRNRRRFPLTTSLLLCFGAGVLLATALVHILPEVRKQTNTNLAEISLCGGFFIIYFIDEFIHYFFGEAIQHSHGSTSNSSLNLVGSNIPQPQPTTYGAIRDESDPLLHGNTLRVDNNNQADEHHHHHQHDSSAHEHSHNNRNSIHCNDETAVSEANAQICHTSHTEPCAQSMTGTLGLFVALSLHSAIEGVAIGVQNTASKVLLLLGAVACHKFVMGFCLGLQLCSDASTSLRSHFIGILVFALGAVFGIGIGMVIVDAPSGWTSSALSVIQALAGGTLLYVTVCEVISREKTRWHQNPIVKAAGFAQFFAIVSGFAVMCIIDFYLDDDDG